MTSTLTTDVTEATEPATGRVAPSPRFRLRRRARKIVLTAHVLGSVGWFGIAIMVAFCGIVASTTSDPALPDALFRTMHAAVWLSVPVGIVAVLTGAVLSLGTEWGFVRHWWVVAKIVISFVVIATDVVVISAASNDAIVTGVAPNPLVDGAIAHCVVLAVATVLSIWKPKGRTPLGRRRAGAAAGRS